MNVFNKTLFSSVVMSTDLASPAIPLVNIYGFSIQAVVTGTPTGVFSLQASADPFDYANPTQPPTPANWTTIDGSPCGVTAEANCLWNINGSFYNYVRLVYEDASSGMSTAVLNASLNAKGV